MTNCPECFVGKVTISYAVGHKVEMCDRCGYNPGARRQVANIRTKGGESANKLADVFERAAKDFGIW